MSARFGRIKKRKLRERIEELERIAYGVYGPSNVSGLFDLGTLMIHHLRFVMDGSPDTVQRNDLNISINVKSMDKLRKVIEDGLPVALDGRVFMIKSMSSPGRFSEAFELDLTQIRRR